MQVKHNESNQKVDERLKRIQENQERIASRTRDNRDDVDNRITGLKTLNSKLMSRMKELNIVLERTLERANQRKQAKINKEGNQRTKDKAHAIRVKENEFRNTQVQVAKNHKEILELRKKLSQISGVQQILEMEEQVKNITEQKLRWEKKIKEIESKVKESGKLLNQMEDDEDFILKHKSLVEELRMWKEKVKRSEEQREKDTKSRQNQKEMYAGLARENAQLKEMINKVRLDKNLPESKINDEGQLETTMDDEGLTEEEITKLQSAKQALQNKLKD